MFPLLYIWDDWGLLALRIALGLVLAIHGIPKLKNIRGTGAWFASEGFKPGMFWAVVVTLLEFFGGIALILGFLSQALAALLVVQFLVILIWKIKKGDSFVGGYELDIFIFATALAILSLGGGSYAVDAFLW
ncbi:MAG: DoxX family protein [Patescibacteria group bacterium]